MIYTCTLNPSLDYFIKEDVYLGKLNRVENTAYDVGGKGIIVSVLANNLGIESTAIGFLGGFTGEFILNELKKYEKINLDFTGIKDNTRINIKINNGIETEINGATQRITKNEWDVFLEKLETIKKGDVLILSGSVCKGVTDNMYKTIMEKANEKGVMLIVDSTKENLIIGCRQKAFLVKPNKKELDEVFEVKIKCEKEIIYYAKQLQKLGAKNVLVSLGREGAILVTKNSTYKGYGVDGNVMSTVGAGDSMLSGFLIEFLKTEDYGKALKFSCACGSSTAFSEGVGNKEDIYKIVKHIKMIEMQS